MKDRALLAAALLLLGAPAMAAPLPAQSALRVERAWIRWLPANLPVAGYAVIVNSGDTPARLTGATSPDYAMVTLHHSRLADGDSTMVKVADMQVPAHGTAALAPGGYHLMLMHARRPIKPGDKVPMTLRFANGATLQVDFSVLPANSVGPSASD